MAAIETIHPHPSAAEVAKIVERLWTHSGEPAEVVSNVFVVLPRSGRVECVFDDVKLLQDSRTTIVRLLERGVAVNVLLPVRLLGLAHEEVRGMDISLQGWLEGEGNIPRFISPEQA
ncbi:hypothetical protein ACIO14_07335 [Nocardia fluminea]|uniref:hypothetical protein n=1 Tax=Nocardia fluminea TaxID=134984 RepID=UPI00382F90D6